MLKYFLPDFQMGYDMGLGGCWPAGYYLAYSKIIQIKSFGTGMLFFLCIIYIPM
jgi:hypothetical protein